ncbi:MAG TPA: anti-sigma factor [Solirubrobacteraceae bacterium]|nr:anti-sigma factor [Solirubrobacteraceae bacterium]
MSSREHIPGCPGSIDVAPYVLGALEEQELQSFGEHLLTCAECRLEVAELQAVVDQLAISAPPVLAPEVLSERVLETVRSQADVFNAAGQLADRPARRAPRLGFALAGAGAGLAAVVALVLVLVLGGGSSKPSERVITGKVSGVASGAQVSLDNRDGRAELRLARMPQPGRGRIYEVWLVRGKHAPERTNALFGVSTAGAGTVDVPGNLHGVDQVLVTSEPTGGSSAPTREPVIAVELS